MRTLAIGDIHGCYDALVTLESLVRFQDDDRLVTLGDYIDRGPDSKRVLKWLIQKSRSGNLHPLRGNHELILFDARESDLAFRRWVQVGGDTVLSSYKTESLDGIPKSHWEFLSQSLLPYFETENHLFVHASAYSDHPMSEQPPYMLYWERFASSPPHQSGKTLVCGHTIQKSGWPRVNRPSGKANSEIHGVCIDTGAYAGGWLTCLDVDSGKCYQANQSGETRTFFLDEIES